MSWFTKSQGNGSSQWWLYVYLKNGQVKEYGPRMTKDEIVDLRRAMIEEWNLKAQVNKVPGYEVKRTEIQIGRK